MLGSERTERGKSRGRELVTWWSSETFSTFARSFFKSRKLFPLLSEPSAESGNMFARAERVIVSSEIFSPHSIVSETFSTFANTCFKERKFVLHKPILML